MFGKKGVQRMGVLVTSALVFGLVVGVLPATAAPTNPGGSVNLNDLLAGQTRTFEISLTHNGSQGGGVGPLATPADDDINLVVITPPIDLIDPSSVQGPGSWSGRITGDPPRIVFEGDTLAPGDTAEFQIVGAVTRPGTDDGDDWLVRASDDGGISTSKATGNLFTNIRVLQVQSVALVEPAGVTDLTVTATQDNVCARTRVLNAGSAVLDVTPTLSATGVTVGEPRLANPADPCSNPAISSAPIAAGGVQEFDFPLTFGSQGTRTLVADASAAGADAFDTNVNVTVQPKAVLTYVASSLSPRALPPGTEDQVFSIDVNKSPGGSPAISLDAAETTFEFAACTPPRSLTSPGDLGAGGVSNVNLTFQPCDVIGDNGSYEVTGTYGYTDANDFIQDITDLDITDQIRLDDLIPVVDVEIEVPTSQVPGEDGAITHDQPFTITVDVDDTRDEGVVGPCPASNGVDGCEITESFLRFYDGQDGSGAVLGEHPFEISNANGRNSTSVELGVGDIPVGALSVQAFASAADDAGNASAEAQSNVPDVDIIAPEIASAGTLPDMGRREILVQISEPVAGGTGDFSALDWNVEVEGENNPVTAVRGDGAQVILTVQNVLPCDVSQGIVSYALFEGPGGTILGTPYHDRVGQEMGNQDEGLGDGIAPLAPIVEQVQGRGEQVGKFWFSDSSPATTVGNEDDEADCLAVADGYGLELYEDANGNGEFDGSAGGDTLLATADADDLQATFTSFTTTFTGEATELGRFEAKAFVRAFDINDNPTPAADVTAAAVDFVLDQIAPNITGVIVAGDEITVAFDEDVAFGRDASVDWRLFGMRPNRTRESEFEISTPSGGPGHRLLTATDPDFDPTVTDVRMAYEFIGAAEDRYTDRAGNFLGDASVSAS